MDGNNGNNKIMNIFIANWKMNPTTEKEAVGLVADIQKEFQISDFKIQNFDIVFCVPFVFIKSIKETLANSNSEVFKLGAQNVFWEDAGTFTGEISPLMLKDLGCEYAIVGHSERKKMFGETIEDICKKINALLKVGIAPVVCVGEMEKSSKKLEGAEKQVNVILDSVPKTKISKLIFAYEPAWAISDGKKAASVLPSSDDVLSAKLLIQKCLSKKLSRNKIAEMPIIYGGSVNASNITKYAGEGKMDGALVGGASLKVKEFVKIVKSCNLSSRASA